MNWSWSKKPVPPPAHEGYREAAEKGPDPIRLPPELDPEVEEAKALLARLEAYEQNKPKPWSWARTVAFVAMQAFFQLLVPAIVAGLLTWARHH